MPPLVVAIDGRSGAGKSTLAILLRLELTTLWQSAAVAVISGDDFYAGGSLAVWRSRSAEDNANLVIDWQKEIDVLSTLRATGQATWHAFDWQSDQWDSDAPPFSATESVCRSSRVVLLEGVYSARRELIDVVDLRVLLQVEHETRLQQLHQRDGNVRDAEWARLWNEAEDLYFEKLLDPQTLDLVVEADG
ncbi:MAG: hypothetical protein KTR33_03410 [Gammaproteobacteria bacterium]|nr:hypothetical protein [Gammaproteobacteria bacterium]